MLSYFYPTHNPQKTALYLQLAPIKPPLQDLHIFRHLTPDNPFKLGYK